MKSARILIFGDSIGQGFYDDVSGGWAQRLQRDFFADEIAGKSEINVINLSVSGHTSQEVLTRIEPETRARAMYDLVTVIAIGVNDSYERDRVRRTGEHEFEENITKIIATAKSFGAVLVLGCSACVEERVQPTEWDSTLRYSNDLIRKYEGILQKCANKNKVAFVPLWQTMHDAQQLQETMPDGIHPNAAGHEVLYKIIRSELTEVI